MGFAVNLYLIRTSKLEIFSRKNIFFTLSCDLTKSYFNLKS